MAIGNLTLYFSIPFYYGLASDGKVEVTASTRTWTRFLLICGRHLDVSLHGAPLARTGVLCHEPYIGCP
jgi:hypothetical protein